MQKNSALKSFNIHPASLAVLELESLEFRKLRFDLIYYFQVFNYLIPFDPNEVFLIEKPITLFYRIVAAWNALPAT